VIRSRCNSCGAPILWAITSTGKRMPVDAEPSPVGNVLLIVRSGEEPRAEVVPRGTKSNLLRVSHFATCPNSAKHRKPRT
jgi:hypothetical protein